MSRIISQFLDKSESPVSIALQELERLSGYPSADVRLLADVSRTVNHKIADLGLDVNDTKNKELYHALLARVHNDEQNLSRLIGLDDKQVAPDKFAQRVLAFINYADMPINVWALKRSVAKSLLHNHQPRKVMKHLRYRSVDSMLKRENVIELFAALRFCESSRWQKSFWQEVAKVRPSNFEMRPAETLVMSLERWKDAAGKNDPVTSVPQLGALVIWPSAKTKSLGSIGLSLLLIQNLNSIKLFSTFIKLKQMEPDFGNIYLQIMQKGLEPAFNINHLPVSWQAVFRSYGKLLEHGEAELFDPYITADDLLFDKPTEVLAKLSPRLKWWSDLDHVAYHNGTKPISFNIADVLNNFHHKEPYKNRSYDHLQQSFWHELIARYLSFPAVQALAAGPTSSGQLSDTFDIDTSKISQPLVQNQYLKAL